MMRKNFNNLTPDKHERLSILSEECGEVVKIIGKIFRHGYESCHPDDLSTTNRELLEKELGDVQFAVEFMVRRGDVNALDIDNFCQTKERRIQKYLHHNKIEAHELLTKGA